MTTDADDLGKGEIIGGRSSLLSFIDARQAAEGLSDAELCRRAGMGPNILYNLRKYPSRNLMAPTLIALVNALGYDLVAVPEQRE